MNGTKPYQWFEMPDSITPSDRMVEGTPPPSEDPEDWRCHATGLSGEGECGRALPCRHHRNAKRWDT